MYTYETLGQTDVHKIHQAFIGAFSDYQVNFNPSLEFFRRMLDRRGCILECSIGAFKEPGHELVGLILNGVRSWNGKQTAYDVATGIDPRHRGKGISSQMFHLSLELLAKNNVEQYLLEVLQSNKTAFEIYKKLGFSIVRHYSIFERGKHFHFQKEPAYKVESIAAFKLGEWEQVRTFWDFKPSWQNSIDSILAAANEFQYVVVRSGSAIIGYGLVEKNTGDVPMIAVQKSHRRKGVGSSIVAALQNITQTETLRVLNVDDAYVGTKLFLKEVGFIQTNSQYEMTRPLK